jgi:dTDP-4-dehydrorhamnose reductase
VIVLITGAGGQLGRELQRTAPGGIELVSMSRAELDISDPDSVTRVIDDRGPELVINAAAYTAVDRAEEESELAVSINGQGPGHLARALASRGGRMIQISTDFVFAGDSGLPYGPDSETRPQSVYGCSKLEGERQVMAELPNSATIIRTAWVYSSFGSNFVKTMLRLMNERECIEVVGDQIGSPTWAFGLAGTIWHLAASVDATGIFHWTDAGVASWYDFAVAIRDQARKVGWVRVGQCRVEPTTTKARPSPAPRPHYGVLDKTSTWAFLGQRSPHWRGQLHRMIEELRAESNA